MSYMEKVREMTGSDASSVELALHTLKRSELPTLIVEGVHDRAIYRWIERLLDVPKVDLLPVGNRDVLLDVYERRSEFDSHLPVAFMADLDKWVFDKFDIVSRKYKDIVWTTGYSLENDLYSDGDPETAYITSSKKAEYKRALEKAIEIFAHDVATWAARGKSPDDKDVKEYFKDIKAEYKLRLRGKNLFEVLFKFCDARNHLELCKDVFDTINLDEGYPPLLSRLILEIQKKIKDKQSAIRETQPDQKFVAESLFEKLLS